MRGEVVWDIGIKFEVDLGIDKVVILGAETFGLWEVELESAFWLGREIFWFRYSMKLKSLTVVTLEVESGNSGDTALSGPSPVLASGLRILRMGSLAACDSSRILVYKSVCSQCLLTKKDRA